MNERKRTTVYETDRGTRLDTESLTAFIDGLNVALGEIPHEHQSAAVIEFESDYESSRVAMSIYYDRPLTEEEIEAEGQEARKRIEARKRDHDATERAEWERLKAKFGGSDAGA